MLLKAGTILGSFVLSVQIASGSALFGLNPIGGDDPPCDALPALVDKTCEQDQRSRFVCPSASEYKECAAGNAAQTKTKLCSPKTGDPVCKGSGCVRTNNDKFAPDPCK
jgi:hypothetical protein